LSTSASWTNQSVYTYCNLSGAGAIAGIGVDAGGNAYVTYAAGGAPYFAEIARGSADSVTPCNGLGGFHGPVAFGVSANAGGAVAANSSTVFFVNHTLTPSPAANDEVDVATFGLGSFSPIPIPPVAGVSNGLAGADVDPTDGSLWVVARYTNLVYHISGTPGVTSSYGVDNGGAGYALASGCSPDGIVDDGSKLYVSCSGSTVTFVLTPNGTNAPTVTSISTAAGAGGITNWQDIAIGPDGYLWLQTSATTIAKFDRTAGGSALATLSTGGVLDGMVAGGDGDLWLGDPTGSGSVHRLGSGVGP
jgi:streptogramin lyase